MPEKNQMRKLIEAFDRFDFYLEDKLNRDIEENRKGAFALPFTDENGNPRFSEDSAYVHRRPPVDTAVKFCEENGLRMKGHCLVYNSFQPDWIGEDSREIKIKIDRRLKMIAERYP